MRDPSELRVRSKRSARTVNYEHQQTTRNREGGQRKWMSGVAMRAGQRERSNKLKGLPDEATGAVQREGCCLLNRRLPGRDEGSGTGTVAGFLTRNKPELPYWATTQQPLCQQQRPNHLLPSCSYFALANIARSHTKQRLYSNKQTPNVSFLPPIHISLFTSTTTQILAMVYFVENLPGLMVGG